MPTRDSESFPIPITLLSLVSLATSVPAQPLAAGQVAGRQRIEHAQGEGETGRWAADRARIDGDVVRQVVRIDAGDGDQANTNLRRPPVRRGMRPHAHRKHPRLALRHALDYQRHGRAGTHGTAVPLVVQRVTQGKTRIETKCGKCGAPNRVTAAPGETRVAYTCKECGDKQKTL